MYMEKIEQSQIKSRDNNYREPTMLIDIYKAKIWPNFHKTKLIDIQNSNLTQIMPHTNFLHIYWLLKINHETHNRVSN